MCVCNLCTYVILNMGYYCAWGDAKIMCSSEEEGYEYHVSDGREKRRDRFSETFNETSSGTALPISDDADRQFWAEDELSNASESRQKLSVKRKRRHSVSYRNRTANRSQSCAPNSSSSSSDSIYAEISPKVCKMRKYCRRQTLKAKKIQSVNVEKKSSTNIEEIAYTMNEVLSPECQAASTSNKKSAGSQPRYEIQANLMRRNHRKRANDSTCAKKIELQKMRGSSK